MCVWEVGMDVSQNNTNHWYPFAPLHGERHCEPDLCVLAQNTTQQFWLGCNPGLLSLESNATRDKKKWNDKKANKSMRKI